MVDVKTTEEEWLFALAGLPTWTPPLLPTVVVVPHPDDETLAAGGLIAHLRGRDVPVRVIAITDGEKAYGESTTLGRIRAIEQQAALEELGVRAESIFRLQIEDSGVARFEDLLLQAMLELVPEGSHLIAPWQHDWHPDHEACGRVANEVARHKGTSLSSWFFWTWHTATPDVLRSLNLRSFPLDASMLETKQRALACHTSQLTHASGQPILTQAFLEPARRPFEVFAIA